MIRYRHPRPTSFRLSTPAEVIEAYVGELEYMWFVTSAESEFFSRWHDCPHMMEVNEDNHVVRQYSQEPYVCTGQLSFHHKGRSFVLEPDSARAFIARYGLLPEDT